MNKWGKATIQAGLIVTAFATVSTGVANAGMHTNGDSSVLGGTQLNAPISVPINLSGNAISALGFAAAYQRGGAAVINEGPGHMHTSGNQSLIGGTQINLPISVPINACGNSIAILGLTKAACKSAAIVINRRDPKMKTSGVDSLIGGTQIKLPISVPINVCGNAVSVLGVAKAWCKGIALVINGHRHEEGHEHEHMRPSLAAAGRKAFRRAFRQDPGPSLPGLSSSNPLSSVPGLGNENPIAQADLPMLSPNSDPITLQPPLQPPAKPGNPSSPGANPLSLGNALSQGAHPDQPGLLQGSPLTQLLSR